MVGMFNYPKRTSTVVLSPDLPKQKPIGWKVYETVGIGPIDHRWYPGDYVYARRIIDGVKYYFTARVIRQMMSSTSYFVQMPHFNWG